MNIIQKSLGSTKLMKSLLYLLLFIISVHCVGNEVCYGSLSMCNLCKYNYYNKIYERILVLPQSNFNPNDCQIKLNHNYTKNSFVGNKSVCSFCEYEQTYNNFSQSLKNESMKIMQFEDGIINISLSQENHILDESIENLEFFRRQYVDIFLKAEQGRAKILLKTGFSIYIGKALSVINLDFFDETKSIGIKSKKYISVC